MQNIALNIVLNGVPQAIANITQFEEVLAQARVELNKLDLGSTAFKKLSAEIKTADNNLRELKKRTEGKDLEGRLGDYGKLGGAIGSSFAAATAAIQLFGDNSEESLKAVTTAQNALTIALAARGVAEGAVVVKNVALEISNYALAKSQAIVGTTLSTTDKITKSFYATLAANPYTAIIAGIGLLITAFSLLTKETSEAEKAQKQFNDELKKDITKETTDLNNLRRTIENVNLSLATRKDALKKLREQFPAYFKDLEDEDILTGKVKIGYVALADAIRKAATARFLEKGIAQRAEEIDTLTTKLEKLQGQLDKINKEKPGPIIGSGSIVGVGGAGVEEQSRTQRIANLTNQISATQGRITELKNLDLEASKKIEKIQTQIDDRTGKVEQKEEKITKEKEKQEILDVKALENARLQAEARERQLKGFEALLSFESIANPPQLEKQKTQIDEFLSVIGQLTGVTTLVGSSLTKMFEEVQQQPDPFAGIVLNIENLKKVADQTLPITQEKLSQLFGEDFTGLLKEQKKDITLFFNTIVAGGKELANLGNFTAEEGLRIFTNGLQIADKLQKEVDQGLITSKQKQIELEQQLLIEYFQRRGLEKEFTELRKIRDDGDKKAYQTFLDTNTEAKNIVTTLGNGIIAIEQFQTATEKIAVDIARGNEQLVLTSELLKKTISELNPEQVGEFLQQIGVDFENGLTLIVKNAEKFGPELTKNLLGGLDTLEVDFEKMSYKQLKVFKETLLAAGVDLEKYGINIEEAFDKTFDKVNQSLKQKVVNGIIGAIEQIQMVLNSLSQTTSLYFQSQFDKLEKRYKRVQDSIVGDTEEANKKRIEAEKIYQDEKIKLEKQAAKTALRISLAQAVANTAEAITKLAAITGGVGAVVAGGLVAALNAVQVGIIANQLASIDEYRRGGIIKKQGGGYITGPSHEMGGVKYQGGGIELEGREAVINRTSTVNYMGLLDQINQAGGGSPIYPNFDDSRIVEAIAKQRNTPIRAYVVESDITERQNTTRRLEQLAKI